MVKCEKCDRDAEWRARETPSGKKFRYFCGSHFSLARDLRSKESPYAQHLSRIKNKEGVS